MVRKHEWAEESFQFIRDNYLTMSCPEMAKCLPGHKREAIGRKIIELGLVRPDTQPKVGDKIGRLKILRLYMGDEKMFFKRLAEVECDCGVIKDNVILTSMVQGITNSCGCYCRELNSNRMKEQNKTHGLSNHRLYNIHKGILDRCENPKNAAWHRYGGRGISVCPTWQKFEVFYEWAINNGYRDDLTIDRINNDKGYFAENSHWATAEQQGNNKGNNHHLTAFGETKTIKQWSRDSRSRVKYTTLLYRIENECWDAETAITTPSEESWRLDAEMITAFGESKSIMDWSLDNRSKVSYNALRIRILKCGWEPELAITAEVDSHPKSLMLTAFGETKSIPSWTKDLRCKSTRQTMNHRVKKLGWDHERAIVTPNR